MTATQVTALTGLNRNTVNRYLTLIRQTVAQHCERESPFSGEVEADESYFGGRRKGPRGRGAAGEVPAFGLLKRSGKVYTRIVEDVSRKTLRQTIRTKVVPESVIYTDSFCSYGGLVLDGFKHFRIDRRECFAAGRRRHVNGIENFRGYL